MREVAGAFFSRRHVRNARDAFARTRAFIIGEEERVVAHDWTTERAAKLIAQVLRLRLSRGREKVARVERGVAMKFKQGTVKVVRTRLRDDVDLRAGIAAKRSIVSARQHFKLANRIDGRTDAERVQLG